MTQKTKARIALTAFLAACLIPSAGMLLLPQGEAAANQTLAPAPRLFLEDGSFNTQVLDEVTDYVADHFAFRQEMITAGAALDAAVFHVSSEEDVVLGREDWLFYRETLDDYLHTDPLSEQQLFGAARTLALLQEYAQSRGARLYVTVAPNKASLYPEYLPNVGEPLAGEDDIDRLVPYLEEQGVSYIDLFTPFRETDEVLYYHTDSHWNMRGAALAHDTLIAGLGKADQEPFFDGSYHMGESHLGDLYEMVFPTGTKTEEDAAYDREFAFSYARPIRSAEDQFIQTENPDRSGNLLMFRRRPVHSDREPGPERKPAHVPRLLRQPAAPLFGGRLRPGRLLSGHALYHVPAGPDRGGHGAHRDCGAQPGLVGHPGPHLPGTGAGPERRAPPGYGPGPAHRRGGRPAGGVHPPGGLPHWRCGRRFPHLCSAGGYALRGLPGGRGGGGSPFHPVRPGGPGPAGL